MPEDAKIQRPDIIKYLKFLLAIGDTYDPVLNGITDAQLEQVVLTTSNQLGFDYPRIPKQDEALLYCLARKEIYWKMATVSAPLYNLELEGMKVSKKVRFDHYMSLIQQVEEEYTSILNDPRRLSVQQGEVIIRKPYTMGKYLKTYELPTPFLYIDKAYTNSFELSIDYNDLQIGDFHESTIYICTEPIWDKYEEKINPKATKVAIIKTPRKPYLRIPNLQPNTKYYILLEVSLVLGLKVQVEIEGVTLNEQE